MAEESRGKLAIYLVRNLILLVMVGFVVFKLVVNPGKPQAMEIYLGDAFTGCMYPIDKLDLKHLLNYSNEELHTHWDELSSKKQGLEIGYQICQ